MLFIRSLANISCIRRMETRLDRLKGWTSSSFEKLRIKDSTSLNILFTTRIFILSFILYTNLTSLCLEYLTRKKEPKRKKTKTRNDSMKSRFKRVYGSSTLSSTVNLNTHKTLTSNYYILLMQIGLLLDRHINRTKISRELLRQIKRHKECHKTLLNKEKNCLSKA